MRFEPPCEDEVDEPFVDEPDCPEPLDPLDPLLHEVAELFKFVQPDGAEVLLHTEVALLLVDLHLPLPHANPKHLSHV